MYSLKKIIIFLLLQIVVVALYLRKYTSNRLRTNLILIDVANNSKSEYFKVLYDTLQNLNAFIIDVKVLEEINQNNFVQQPIEIFGINENNLQSVIENFNLLEEKLKCKITFKNGTYFSKEKKVTIIYFDCKYSTKLQLSVFYNKNNFFWIGSDDGNFNPKIFGDVARLMSQIEKFELIKINDYQYLIPFNIKKFLFDYDHSKLRECNYELAEYNYKLSNGTYKQNPVKNKLMLSGLGFITSTLESKLKSYWIGSGTLLGWYRDCGIIPFTEDIDLAMRIENSDDDLLKTFLGNPIARIQVIFAFPNDSYEFHLVDKNFRYDIFFVYTLNSTYQYYGYHMNNIKYKQLLPHFGELCSAELLDIKVIVPCDVFNYLNYMYGPYEAWKVPQKKNYTWPYLDLTAGEKWPDDKKNLVVKFYNKYGLFDFYKPSPY